MDSSLNIAMQGLTFHARASTKFTPPLCRTPLRQKAGRLRSLSRMPNEDSGFDVISSCFRHVIGRFIFIRLLGRHLMPLTTPSPRRSPPRLLNAAARGGLEPPPTRRLRRAYLHLPHSMKERVHFYISSPSFLRDTPLVHESGHDNSSATSRDFSGTNRERFGLSESGHPVEDVAGDDRLRLL